MDLSHRFYDFIGNELNIGDFVVYPGGGNGKGNYGQVLGRIVKLDSNKNIISFDRIDVTWNHTNNFHPSHLKNAILVEEDNKFYAVQIKTVNIKNHNTLVKVSDVSEKIKIIFDKVSTQDKNVFNIITANELSYWLLGSSSFKSPFIIDMNKPLSLCKQFISELELNNLEKPSYIFEHPSENFIYLGWKKDGDSTLQIEFHLDGEIVLLNSNNLQNNGKTLKEYNFTEIKEFLQLK